MCSHINVGVGVDLTIKELAVTIKAVVGYKGNIDFDPSKPDGSPRKLLGGRRINRLGWGPQLDIKDGLVNAYDDFLGYYDK